MATCCLLAICHTFFWHSICIYSFNLFCWCQKLFLPSNQTLTEKIETVDPKGADLNLNTWTIKAENELYMNSLLHRLVYSSSRAYLSVILGLFYTSYTCIKCVKQTKDQTKLFSKQTMFFRRLGVWNYDQLPWIFSKHRPQRDSNHFFFEVSIKIQLHT